MELIIAADVSCHWNIIDSKRMIHVLEAEVYLYQKIVISQETIQVQKYEILQDLGK